MKKNQNKKLERRKRKMLLAIIMVLFTGVILTTSTYAWFTSNDNVTIEGIEVAINSESGLQISTDATTWRPSLGMDDFRNSTCSTTKCINQIPSDYISPVSTSGDIYTNSDLVGETRAGQLKMFKGVIDSVGGNYVLNSTREIDRSGNAGNYIAFDIFLNTSSQEGKDIYLTDQSSVSLVNSSPDGIQNAARVAFIVEGTGSIDDNLSDIQELYTENAADVVIWEPNSTSHTSGGVANARDVYNITDLSSPLSYKGIIAEFNGVPLNTTVLDPAHVNYFKDVSGGFLKNTSITSSSYLSLFHIDKGITKVRVYMWIEGQDVDCENNASGASVKFDLFFSTKSSASAGASPSPSPSSSPTV